MTILLTKAARWLMDGLRHFYPVAICFVGGLMMMAAGDGFGLAGVVIAIAAFAWAIDLAAAKAAAHAKEETAAKLIAMLVGGGDTTVTIDINHNTPPQTEKREAE